MLQIRIVEGNDTAILEAKTNSFLAGIPTEAVKGISVDVNSLAAVVQYQVAEAWQDRICAECQYWDDSGSTSNVSGYCQESGRRCRFNCKACANFKDVRR